MSPTHAPSHLRVVGILVLLTVSAPNLGAGAPRQLEPTVLPTHAQLDVKPIKQPYMLCLAASVSMVLAYWGLEIPTERLAEQVNIYKTGTSGDDFLPLVAALGFQGFLVQPTFEDLLEHVAKGRPVIVSFPRGHAQRHAVVVTGYDKTDRLLWINDPASGRQETDSFDSMRRVWERGGRWTLLIVPGRQSR